MGLMEDLKVHRETRVKGLNRDWCVCVYVFVCVCMCVYVHVCTYVSIYLPV